MRVNLDKWYVNVLGGFYIVWNMLIWYNLKYYFVYVELGLVFCIKIVFVINFFKKNNILISFKEGLVFFV